MKLIRWTAFTLLSCGILLALYALSLIADLWPHPMDGLHNYYVNYNTAILYLCYALIAIIVSVAVIVTHKAKFVTLRFGKAGSALLLFGGASIVRNRL